MSKKQQAAEVGAADLTPMIDMVFQLLIFFMILINFSEADQNQRVVLPKSELAKPPEQPLKDAITVHVATASPGATKYIIILGSNEIRSLDDFEGYLTQVIKDRVAASSGKTVQDLPLIIRADAGAKTGFVQEVIQVCQKLRLEKFILRAQGQE